ncbi:MULTISPECIES: hypothetical protein [Enterococcus]|uniref:hypothetical protein n=1 Tax=Enterococcus TaxID=1350 RepID=UPI000EBB215C|nr:MULTISPECIES: hypothetical protein [Enterococcus]HCM86041.1 hypothetical protein [Enterococcus sp.]
MIELILGLLVLIWPLAKVPQLLKNKQLQGVYFTSDKRVFIPKYMNFGNGLNTNNKIGFIINVLLGTLLIVAGILDLVSLG